MEYDVTDNTCIWYPQSNVQLGLLARVQYPQSNMQLGLAGLRSSFRSSIFLRMVWHRARCDPSSEDEAAEFDSR